MSATNFSFRPAASFDAALLAQLVNIAGEGLPLYLWEQMAAPGETPWDVGQKRAAREQGSFSYRNSVLIECDCEAVGCLIGYDIPYVAEPIGDDMPAMFRPLQELENLAPGTWYVNVLAVFPAFRNKGLGMALLKRADEIGRKSNRSGMSVIVSDANKGARRLYERCGYRERATRIMVKEGWQNDGQAWVLLAKDF